MRDLSGFLVTRKTILTLKSNARIHWLSYAVARHLNGDCAGAVQAIDLYLSTIPEDAEERKRGFESGELALYKNLLLAEMPNNLEVALQHLDECRHVVVDQTSWLKMKGTYQLRLGRHGDAKGTFLRMMDRGLTEDYRVQTGYMCALLEVEPSVSLSAMEMNGTRTLATLKPLSSEERQTLLDSYRTELSERFPKSTAVRRIPLTLLEGDDLRDAVDAYCRKGLVRGVPSLGSDLNALFLYEKDGAYAVAADSADIRVHPTCIMIAGIVDKFIATLTADSKFPDSEDEESPSTLLWAWYLRAYIHEICGEYTLALNLAERCLKHTPTGVDIYELKGRVLKAAGDISAAANCLDEGRDLDQQDRYINNQTTKYLLQAGKDTIAKERVALFTRHEGNPEQNLFDMQCAWYELELADCMRRKNQWGKSLKKYLAVVSHFEDWHEDQFDFHGYCIRKTTIRAYIDVLRFEDELWGLDNYVRAAEGIGRIYLHLHDNPALTKTEEEPDYSSMSSAERKKAKAIARKKKKTTEKKKLEAEEAKKASEAKGGSNQKKGPKPPETDEDPSGEALLKLEPLAEAKKYSATLAKYAPRSLPAWILRYDVAIRRKKTLMAMQALFKAKAINAESGELFTRIVDFAGKADPVKDCHQAVKEVLKSEISKLLDGKTLTAFVADAAAQARTDPLTYLSLRIAIAEAMVHTKAGSIGDASSLIVDHGLDGRAVTVEVVRSALSLLTTFGSEASQARSEWVDGVKERFPLLEDFE